MRICVCLIVRCCESLRVFVISLVLAVGVGTGLVEVRARGGGEGKGCLGCGVEVV